MNTTEAALWLKSQEVMSPFLQLFSAFSIIKHRAYTILVEYIPLSFDPGNKSQLGELERDNGLNPEGVLSAKWIKPPYQRAQGQRTAHAILGLSQLAGANTAIRDGLIIAGKRVWARKMLTEPRRCLKCQAIGVMHLAATCKQDHDACGNCSESHRTSNCPNADSTAHACANCKTKGHPAWDRLCPMFVKHSNRLNARVPENKYRYFPTTLDPATWELLAGPDPSESEEERQEPNEPNSWTTVGGHGCTGNPHGGGMTGRSARVRRATVLEPAKLLVFGRYT